MITKSFKIGEYCIGGIIKAEIKKDILILKALDYNTKKEILSFTYPTEDINIRDMWFTLTEWTTAYYADKIIDWIKLKIK
jgi:hypothetical protein